MHIHISVCLLCFSVPSLSCFFFFLPPSPDLESFDRLTASCLYSGRNESKNPTSSVKLGRNQKWCLPNVRVQIKQNKMRRTGKGKEQFFGIKYITSISNIHAYRVQHEYCSITNIPRHAHFKLNLNSR